jgi:hypothetical protein
MASTMTFEAFIDRSSHFRAPERTETTLPTPFGNAPTRRRNRQTLRVNLARFNAS